MADNLTTALDTFTYVYANIAFSGWDISTEVYELVC